MSDTGMQGLGGGGSGANCPPNLEVFGVSPQLRTVDVFHFYFCLFLHVNLGPSQKKYLAGQIREVNSFG